MSNKKKIVILYSGGLDSFIMKKLAEAKYPDLDLTLVHFDIGQAYSEKEDNAIKNSGFEDEKDKYWFFDCIIYFDYI